MKTILIILAVVMLAVPASGQIPRLINYQGVLTDDMGAVVSDGSYNMTFRLYDVPSGGSDLWEETIPVIVSKGIFSTTLGHDIPIDEAFDKPLYLALEINGGGELSPRRLFTANAYAFSARAIYGVSNIFPAEGNVGIGLMNPTAPLHIYTAIADPNTPALLIQNTGNQSLIDFRMATVTEARIRHNAGSDFFFGTLTNGAVSLRTNDLTRLRIVGDGKVGIGVIGPQERLDVAGAIRLGTTAESNAGTIRWTGADFEGYDGSLWNSLTTGGGSGLPSGTSGQTLRHDGAQWTATDNLYNDGNNIGIGTTTPGYPLHVIQPSLSITGIQLDSHNASWASMWINAVNPLGTPAYGYMRESGAWGYHELSADSSWSLVINKYIPLHVRKDGWTAFGDESVDESMNLPGALRLGTTSGSNAGTVRWTGSDFEGYNGSSWKSLTSATTAGTANQTLRYDGADWVASSALSNDGTHVGIGTDMPGELLHVYDGTLGKATASVETGVPTAEATVGLVTSGGATTSQLSLKKSGPEKTGTTAGSIPLANLSRLTTGPDAGALMLQTMATEPIHFVTSNIRRSTITPYGEWIRYNSAGYRIFRFWDFAGYGGRYEQHDETGNVTLAMGGSGSTAGGGTISVRRNAIMQSIGFSVIGNYLDTEGTRVSITGPSSAIVLDASTTGDDTAVFPADAISADEIRDEPGLGSNTDNFVSIEETETVILSQTITAPAAGYVVAIATANVFENGTFAHVSISTSSTDMSSNTYGEGGVITCHEVFDVTAGPNIFYFLGVRGTGGTAFCTRAKLTAIFIPTSYGSVSTASGAGIHANDPVMSRVGMTSTEIEAERSASIEANNARIEMELAEMRARIEALQAELDNSEIYNKGEQE